MFLSLTIRKGESPAKRSSILTWQQIIGDENKNNSL